MGYATTRARRTHRVHRHATSVHVRVSSPVHRRVRRGLELFKFLIAEAVAAFGTAQILTQYGLEDTVLDLFYNVLGGVLVAIFATAHLTDVAEQLAARLNTRQT